MNYTVEIQTSTVSNLDFTLQNPLNTSSINVESSEEASLGLGKRAKTRLEPQSQQKVTAMKTRA